MSALAPKETQAPGADIEQALDSQSDHGVVWGTELYGINAEHEVWAYPKRVGGRQSRTLVMEQPHGGTKGVRTELMPIDG